MAVYDTPQSVHMQKAISGKGGVPKQNTKARAATKAGGKKRARKTK